MPNRLLHRAANGTPRRAQQAPRRARNAMVEPWAVAECHGLVSPGEKL